MKYLSLSQTNNLGKSYIGTYDISIIVIRAIVYQQTLNFNVEMRSISFVEEGTISLIR